MKERLEQSWEHLYNLKFDEGVRQTKIENSADRVEDVDYLAIERSKGKEEGLKIGMDIVKQMIREID